MKLVIIINTKDHETAWKALRLGITALDAGHMVSVFLLGNDVEIEKIADDRFDVAELLKRFAGKEVSLLGCSTCMGLRHQEGGRIVKSTLQDLVKLITNSDKVVTFG